MAKKKTTATKTTSSASKKSATRKTTTAGTPAPNRTSATPAGKDATTKKASVEAEPKTAPREAPREAPRKSRLPSILGGKKGERQPIRCYLCGQRFEVSGRTMSTTCTACNKAIKVEDVQVKSYLPVNDLQTCGRITVTKRGRVAAKRIQSGRGIVCEGSLEGSIETDGGLALGAKSSWKGKELHCRTLVVADGATLNGHVQVPWERE